MSAMTWYDHETRSLWSQPWGRAISGQYKGIELFLLPMQLMTWSEWKSTYPHTKIMLNDLDRVRNNRQTASYKFVIGLVLSDDAKAYYFLDVRKAGGINDWLEEIPVVIWASESAYQSFIRSVDGEILSFHYDGEYLIDHQTGSKWDPMRGIAVEGIYKGKSLQIVPSLSAYDWAWEDFYPNSTFYEP